jgi:recombination endonuclease VII
MGNRTCPSCEGSFVPSSNHQRWCGRTCYNRERQRRYLVLNGPSSVTRSCRYCSVSYSSPDGRQHYCSAECTRTAKSLREAFRRYGITMQEYRAVWVRQGGVCAICKQPERTERNHLLTIDHDHVMGHVRGLLCSQCNRAIGLLQDDPKVIEAAARYVRENRQMKLLLVI